MSIISASDIDIRKISADGSVIKTVISGETENISGMDVNTATNTIYWSAGK